MQSFMRAILSENCSTTDRSPHVLVHEEDDQAPALAEHTPRTRSADERAAAAFRERPSAEAAVSPRNAASGVRHGVLLGRGAALLAAAGRLHNRGWLRRRRYQESDVRGSLLGVHQSRRGGPG